MLLRKLKYITCIGLCFITLTGFSFLGKSDSSSSIFSGKYNEELQRTEYAVPDNTNFKSYMAYQKITSKTSNQYIMQLFCDTTYRGIRCINGRYCIAIGTRFDAKVGQYVDIVLKNGYTINCVVGDIKADKDTNSDNVFTMVNNCCSEFIIDREVLYDNIAKRGNMSYIYPWWNSEVENIYVYDECIDIDYLRNFYKEYVTKYGEIILDVDKEVNTEETAEEPVQETGGE